MPEAWYEVARRLAARLARAPWHYEWGTVGVALSEAGHARGDLGLHRAVLAFVDAHVGRDGRIRRYDPSAANLDDVNPGRLVVTAWGAMRQPRYRLAARRLAEQLRRQPVNARGGWWHKARYPDQQWVDSSFMALPFLATYVRAVERDGWPAVILRQAWLAWTALRDPETGLLRHGFDASRRERWADPVTGRSRHAWARGMGWWSMAMVDVLDQIGDDCRITEVLAPLLQETADTVLAFQDPATGCWWHVLDAPGRPGNYLEASGTAFLAFALMKGARLGLLSPAAGRAGMRGYRGLRRFLRRDASGVWHLDGGNRVAGLGGTPYRDGSFGYYVSERPVSDDPKALAGWIRAGVEAERAGFQEA